MGLREFLFGPKAEDEDEATGYELDLGDLGDAPFEGMPTGKEVNENGAPSLFGDYSGYPGGYPQAVQDWRGGTYEAPVSDMPEEEEPQPRKKFLGLF